MGQALTQYLAARHAYLQGKSTMRLPIYKQDPQSPRHIDIASAAASMKVSQPQPKARRGTVRMAKNRKRLEASLVAYLEPVIYVHKFNRFKNFLWLPWYALCYFLLLIVETAYVNSGSLMQHHKMRCSAGTQRVKAKRQEAANGGTQKKKLLPPSGGTKKLKGAQSKKTGGLFGTQSTRGARKDPNTVGRIAILRA